SQAEGDPALDRSLSRQDRPQGELRAGERPGDRRRRADELRILAKRQQRAARVTLKRPRRRVILFWRHGIELEATIEQNPSWYRRRQSITYRVVGWTGYSRDTSWRAAIRHWVHYQPKRIGTYNVFRSRRDNDLPTWTLKHASNPGPSRTIGRNRR